MVKADEKVKAKYEPEIITSKVTYENPIDISKVPVFTIENCEVVFSSLTSETPKYGHSIMFMLPADSTLPVTDRTMRNQYLQNVQKDNPNIEIIKGSVSLVTSKDVLDKKFTEDKLGRAYINITISNPCLLDDTIDAEGKKKSTKIEKVEQATGTAVVRYFRVLDAWTGEGIEPDIFKYENGNKVKTFINPKTKEEKPLYLSRGDIINVKLRPYIKENQKNGELTLRYNLLSVEQVQTAWDRGIGRTGSSAKVQEAPTTITNDSLGSIFAGISVASTPVSQPQQTVVPQPQQVVQPKTVAVEQPVENKTETVDTTPAPITNEMPTIDFSALAKLDMSGVNLGE